MSSNPPGSESIKAILQALKVVEDGLQKPLRVLDMADAAGYSLYHFSRLFNRVVHHSPYDYLIRRRLSESANDLQDPAQKIIDIALRYQFSSHESFSRAFKRMFGKAPSLGRDSSTDPHKLLDPVREDMLVLIHSDLLCIQARTLPRLKLVGLVDQSPDPDQHPSVIMRQLKQILGNKKAGGELQQYCILRMYPSDWQSHGLQVMAAAIQDDSTAHHPALTEKILPPGDWAAITAGSSSTDSLLRRFIYQIWLPGADVQLRLPFELEMYNGALSSSTTELLIPVSTS